MNLLKDACFVYFILILLLIFVNSDEHYKKYNGDVPNENRTCNISWDSSYILEPYMTCILMCKLRCHFTSKTFQWSCKNSGSLFLNYCYCCKGEFSKISYII